MEFNLRRIDTQRQYTHNFPTISSSSYLNYTYNSDHNITEGLWRGRSAEPPRNQREMILRELEKEKIRDEIIAEELENAEDELRRGLIRDHGMIEASRTGGFPSASELGQHLRLRTYHRQFPPENRSILIPFQERYDDGGPHRRDIAIYRQPPSEIYSLGQLSGSKRKAATELIREDFSYTVCPISATSARDLNGYVTYVSGREHRAKVGGWRL